MAAASAAALFVPLIPSLLLAQEVRGRVVEEGPGEPVPGAWLELEDEEGVERASTMAGEDGVFRLPAPEAGTYRVHVERIGFRSWTSDPFDLAEGETLSRRLELPVRPVELDGIVATGERRCRIRPERAGEAAQLWREARKALRAAAWTEEHGGLRFEVRTWRRVLSEDLRIREEESRTRSGEGVRPFVSLPGEMLAEQGFVEETGDDRIYYGPDAEALLSDAFQRTHCFWVEEGGAVEGRPEGEEWVGLAFEPAPDRYRPDIRGVAWLDRSTSELRRFEFRYVNAGLPAGADEAGGRVEFRRLPNGAWIVRRWRIRMPTLAREELRIRERVIQGGVAEVRHRHVVTGYEEEGGRVERVYGPEGDPLRLAPPAVVAGRVLSADGGQPVPGATVRAAGTDRSVRTGEDGRFRLELSTGGLYTVEAVEPELAVLGAGGASRDVEVEPGRTARTELRLPPASEVVADLCAKRDTAWHPDEVAGTYPRNGAAFGRVRDADGEPVAGATVEFRWNKWWLRDDGSRPTVRRRRRGTGAKADDRGAYLVCGLPTRGWTFRARAEASEVRSPEAELRIPEDGGHLVHHFKLSEAASIARAEPAEEGTPTEGAIDSVDAAGQGDGTTVVGVVEESGSGRPLSGAEVRLFGAEERAAVTDSAGRFVLRGLRPGRWAAEVRFLGHEVRQEDIVLPRTGVLRPTFRLEVEPVDLPGLTVEVEKTSLSGKMRGFWKREARGIGQFLTRAELEEAPGGRLSEALRGLRGLRVAPCPPPPGSEVATPGCYRLQGTRRQPTGLGGKECEISYFVDGAPFQMDPQEGIDFLSKSDVEAVEVYTGPAQTPSEYGGLRGSCGTVLIWTRHGG